MHCIQYYNGTLQLALEILDLQHFPHRMQYVIARRTISPSRIRTETAVVHGRFFVECFRIPSALTTFAKGAAFSITTEPCD